MAVVHNPHNLSIGSNSGTGVTGFSYSPAGGGQPQVAVSDENTVVVFTPAGGFTGSITFNDIEQADSFANQSGSLTVDGVESGGGSDKTLTFAGAQTGEAGGGLTTGGPSNATVSFAATGLTFS